MAIKRLRCLMMIALMPGDGIEETFDFLWNAIQFYNVRKDSIKYFGNKSKIIPAISGRAYTREEFHIASDEDIA